MNEVLTFEGLNIVMPKELKYSSDSLIDESNRIMQQIMVDRFDVIRSNIGNELFNQLSYDDKMLMVNTAGVIDFGHPIDLDRVEKDIENYDYSH